MVMRKEALPAVCFMLFNCAAFSQGRHYRIATLAFYNVENLFDTLASVDYIDGTRLWGDTLFHRSIPAHGALARKTPFLKRAYSFKNLKGRKVLRRVADLDFTPSGKYHYTAARYRRKIAQLSKALSAIGYAQTHTAPVVIGLAEVENERVLEDLVNTQNLKPYGYKKVHFNSFDPRGIDVALLYQQSRFTPSFTKPYTLYLFDEHKHRKYTRDILLVSGMLDGEMIHFIVNHWPSRYGGEARSRPFRMRAARLIEKQIIPDIRLLDRNPKVVIMGDFNDDPNGRSIREGLGCSGDRQKAIETAGLYNPMVKMYRRGEGTLAWHDSWNLFDQIIVTAALLDGDYSTYKFYKAGIFDAAYLQTPTGAFKGYPYRTYGRGRYQGGYSDHFPVYAYLIKRAK